MLPKSTTRELIDLSGEAVVVVGIPSCVAGGKRLVARAAIVNF